MASEEHLRIIKNGVEVWNQWRAENPDIQPDLSKAKLSKSDLQEINFGSAYLFGANLSNSDLTGANLADAELTFANLQQAILIRANLSRTNLSGARLNKAELRGAELIYTEMRNSILIDANFSGSYIQGANFTNARVDGLDLTEAQAEDTIFGNNQLNLVKGLDRMFHRGPSTIGIDTLYRSGGEIPEIFLRDCGMPSELITFLPSLIGAKEALQFYSCFISYNHSDQEFANRLYSRMRDAHLRVWFAPEDISGGEKIYDQIDRAIQIHDRLLIILSENSLRSEWVMTEIRRARETEIREKRRKLFPIRLVEFEKIRDWGCFDADTGKDLAVEVREYFVPDFSNWKDHVAFEAAFAKLLRDLKATETYGSFKP